MLRAVFEAESLAERAGVVSAFSNQATFAQLGHHQARDVFVGSRRIRGLDDVAVARLGAEPLLHLVSDLGGAANEAVVGSSSAGAGFPAMMAQIASMSAGEGRPQLGLYWKISGAGRERRRSSRISIWSKVTSEGCGTPQARESWSISLRSVIM